MVKMENHLIYLLLNYDWMMMRNLAMGNYQRIFLIHVQILRRKKMLNKFLVGRKSLPGLSVMLDIVSCSNLVGLVTGKSRSIPPRLSSLENNKLSASDDICPSLYKLRNGSAIESIIILSPKK